MKNKNLIFNIILISIIIVVLLIIMVFIINKKSGVNDDKLEREYYEKMEQKMKEDYKYLYDNIDFKENKDYTLTIFLNDLKAAGADMLSYRNYKTKKQCDLYSSYAEITFDKKGKEKIKVYYDCDGKSNYELK